MDDNNYKANVQITKIETIEDGEKIHIKLDLPEKLGWYEDVTMVIEKEGKQEVIPLIYSKSTDNYATFEGEIELQQSAIYHYYFMCRVNDKVKYIKRNSIEDCKIKKEEMYKLSVGFSVPDWAKGAIMYHIFVDRFRRGDKEKINLPNRHLHKNWNEELQIGPDENGVWNNDFYGGDLKGIIEKLDYINSLGVTILYLSPIVRSQSNHRYDTADYLEIDPYAGSETDLKKLCEEAHKRGMKVILDAVFNHTGNDSKYFNEYGNYDSVGAYQSKSSPYYPFYKKNGSDSKFDYWWGMTNLPVCDKDAIEWQNFITGENGVIDKWFSLGIDGLRLDVADELTDEFIELIRKAVKRNKEDGFILGEVWKNPMRMKKYMSFENRGYISSGKCMDTVMDYPLIDSLIRYFKYADKDKLENILKEIMTEYPKDTINSLMNFTSTHDISRLITILGANVFDQYSEWAWNPSNTDLDFCKNFRLTQEEYNRGKEILMLYIFTLNLFPGTLSIFYGDEVGLDGLGNLANRRPFPWDNIDYEILDFYRYIGKIRMDNKALKEGNLNIIDINHNTLSFEREGENNKIFVAVNRSDREQKLIIPREYETDNSEIYTIKKKLVKQLSPYDAIAITKRK